MKCFDCPNAERYHSEMKDITKKLQDAIRSFNRGHFMLAIEDMEAVVIRLERFHNRNLDRDVG